MWQWKGFSCSAQSDGGTIQLDSTGGSLFNKVLERRTIISVCKEHWNIVEVPLTFGAPFLQIKLEIWSGLIVSLMLRNTGKYLLIMLYYQGGSDGPQFNYTAGQLPKTYNQCN